MMQEKAMHFMHTKPDLFAGSVAAALLLAAFGFQAAGYHPCEMCWWQRYPYMAVVALVLVARLLVRLKGQQAWITGLMAALLFAVDAGIAGFHAGVEQGWWEGITHCTADLSLGGDINAALDAIMNAPLVRCDEIAWSLFGISMAGYNFLIATAVTIITAASSLKLRRSETI